MTWVRYDDNVRNHPKVEPLDDATYRLWREALEWSAQNLTDGLVLTRQLGLTSTRASPARARKLVAQQLWHRSGDPSCGSRHCPPPSTVDGWRIHDYWDYQPTAEQVREEQEKARERKRKWMERRKNAVSNGVGNGVPDSGKNGNPAPPRPAPKGGVATPPSAGPPPGGDGAAAAGGAKDQPNSLAVPAWADDPCPHGEPGGFRLLPSTGEARCPMCRAEAA